MPEGAAAESLVEQVRIPFVQRATLTLAGRDRDVFLVDLGLAGVFAELADGPAVGENVGVRFRLPGNAIPIAALCNVAWHHAARTPPRTLPVGVGLHFLELSESHRERLRDYLVEYCRRHTRARRFAPKWPVAGGEGTS